MSLRRSAVFGACLAVAVSAVVAAAFVVAPAAVSAEPSDAALPWPPAGPVGWETDPEKAFARAREEGKGVFVYIATEACPHCKVMQKETWPKDAVIAASKNAICLAIYRWKRDEGPVTGGKAAAKNDAEDSEWATRLDVKAYPQIRLLDGWGRPLRSSAQHENDRTVAQVVAAIEASVTEGKKPEKPAPPPVPESLLARLDAKSRPLALDPIGSVRCRVWTKALAKGEWPVADLVALFRADEDPVLRLALLEKMGGSTVSDSVIDAAADAATEGSSDYVRGAALRLLGQAGGPRAVAALRDTITKALDGKSGWNNPNNVLCEAVQATIAKPDKALVEVLGRVLAKQQANNYATVLATKSLVAIGRAEGAALVKPHLERALKLEGPLAGQIRKEVESLLGQ